MCAYTSELLTRRDKAVIRLAHNRDMSWRLDSGHDGDQAHGHGNDHRHNNGHVDRRVHANGQDHDRGNDLRTGQGRFFVPDTGNPFVGTVPS